MWVKLDDQFVDHPKVFAAATHLNGHHRRGRAVAIYVAAVSYANRHLTDGYIADSVVRAFTLDDEPVRVAQALASRDVRLFERVAGGYRIHDYHEYNPKAAEVKAKLRKDRERKRAEVGGANGGSPAPTKRGKAAPGRQPSAGIPDGIRTDSARIPRASRARDPLLIDQYVPIERSPRLRRGSPTHEPRVLKALVWREVEAAFATPGAALDVPSLTEHCKTVAARAGLVYAVDAFYGYLDGAIARCRARRESASLERRRA